MAKITKIHQSKRPVRRHFIAEWAESRGLRQIDIATELDVDKSLVSRWFAGHLPQAHYQEALAALFQVVPEALLRHPDDDWLARFFQGRQAEERERIKQAMELAWPLRSGTDD
jgi:transcriptional regulator with XRE-family HTH domain